MLAGRWGHRASADIDVCLPKGSGVAALWPSWNAEFVAEVQSLGATEIREKAQGLTVAFEGGEVSLELECGDGWRYEDTFGSLEALSDALRRHGLNPALAVANESVAHAFGSPGGER